MSIKSDILTSLEITNENQCQLNTVILLPMITISIIIDVGFKLI